MNNDLENLEIAVKGLSKPTLTQDRKSMLKHRVFATLVPVEEGYLSKVMAKVTLSTVKKAQIKERVFEFIEARAQKRFVFSSILGWGRRFVSAMMVAFVFFGAFSFVGHESGVVRAATFTTLDVFGGEVFVEREGEFVDVAEGMRLFERDRILTGFDGYANIRFFDDSVSRMSSETEVYVNKLFRPNESFSQSYVEISVKDGTVWSRVVNLVERKSSFVVEAMNVFVSAKKAAFNVEVQEDEVEVGVFSSSVDVTTSGGSDVITSGTKVKLNESQVSSFEEISDEDRTVAWVQENLEDDVAYLSDVESRLLVAKLESIGMEEGDSVDIKNSIRDEAVLFLTFDDIKKQKKKLDLAEKTFVAADLKLSEEGVSDEEKAEALLSLEVFRDEVNGFYDYIKNVRTTDEGYADELAGFVEEKLLMQKKNLSLVLPDEPSYYAKELIDDLELLTAKDDSDLIAIKNQQGLAKISDVEDVVEIAEEAEVDEGQTGDVAESVEPVVVPVVEVAPVVEAIPVPKTVTVPRETYGVQVQGDKPLDPLFR